jgi:hypothetical protein
MPVVPPVSLLASQVPAVQYATTAYNLDSESPTFPAQLDYDLRQFTRYGGGGYAICAGLTFTAPLTGTLDVTFAAGIARLDSFIYLPAAAVLTMPDNTANIWAWICASGNVLQYTTSATPPSGACCAIGRFVSSGGSFTSYSTSGLVYARGGALWRETGDLGAPADTPAADAIYYNKTAGGVYLAAGGAYRGPV